jgi:hypothetical protein
MLQVRDIYTYYDTSLIRKASRSMSPAERS